MKKYKKILFLVLIILSVFVTYKAFKSDQVNYVALGDSLVAGQNPYGEIGYSYSDYLSDILKENNKLKKYTKEYAKSGYKTKDVINDLNNFSKIKKDLRESNLVTISIGANDFLEYVDKNKLNAKEILNLKNFVDKVMPEVSKCIKEVRKYAKGDLYIIGYYNPIPFLFNISEPDINRLFAYIDEKYRIIAKEYNATYISNYELFKKNKDFLPNPLDIHPSLKGYQKMADAIYINLPPKYKKVSN